MFSYRLKIGIKIDKFENSIIFIYQYHNVLFSAFEQGS